MLLANVFEDFYIERKWQAINPGSRRHLKATHEVVIRETGGAKACDPEYVPEGSEQPVGQFMALIQAMLRVHGGHVKQEDINPTTSLLLDYLQDECHLGLLAESSDEVCDAAEAVWHKLKALQDMATDDADGTDIGDLGKPGESEEEGESSSEESEEGSGSPQGKEDSDTESDTEEESGGSSDSDSEDSDEDSDEDSNDIDHGDEDSDEDGDGDDNESGNGSDDSDDSEGEGSEEGSEEGDNAGGDDGEDGSSEGDNEGEGDSPDSEPEKGKSEDGKTNENGVGEVDMKAPSEVIDAADACCGGDYGELKTSSEIIAGIHQTDANNRPYLVYPGAASQDKWEQYNRSKRKEATKAAKGLRQAAGPAATVMANHLRCAIKAQKQNLRVGGLEEGDSLDPDALPGLAMGFDSVHIFSDNFNQLAENTYVQIVVDCSGSMGDSAPQQTCPIHGEVNQKGESCSRKRWDDDRGKQVRCGKPLAYRVTSKAGYAAMTAMVLHDALRLCGVPHSVVGYTNSYAAKCSGASRDMVTYTDSAGNSEQHCRWSRWSSALWMHEFVSAPGLSDDGGAIPYVTGYAANLDGESVIESAKYAVKNAGDCDRLVMIVIADGLPAGANDHGIEDRHLRDCVETVAQAGIEVYGIGVGIGAGYYGRGHEEKYASFYPNQERRGHRAATGHVLIESGVGLSNAVMRQLSDLLIQSSGGRR